MPNFDGNLNNLDAFAINYNYKTGVSESLDVEAYFDEDKNMWAMKMDLSLAGGITNNIAYGFSPKVSDGESIINDLVSPVNLSEKEDEMTFQTTDQLPPESGDKPLIDPVTGLVLVGGAAVAYAARNKLKNGKKKSK